MMRTALTIARASEDLGWLRPADWPDLAVALLVEGCEDAAVAELAGLPPTVSGWETDPLVMPLYERYAVPACTPEESVAWLAATMAAELRARPAVVRGALVRALARLAPSAPESDLAQDCLGVESYLDSHLHAIDERWMRKLDALAGPAVPDSILRVLAKPLRSTVPTGLP